MDDRISRREFLKLAGLGTALTAGLTGAKWALEKGSSEGHSRPETIVATTCNGCSRGCGIHVLVQQGGILRIKPNPDHPLSQGTACSKLSSGLEQLYSANRIAGPLRRTSSNSDRFRAMDWGQALSVIQSIFKEYQPGEIAFLLGASPDHLYDLVRLISVQVGGMYVFRYASEEQWQGQTTLADAVQGIFGMRSLPYFDLHQAQMVYTFGDQIEQSWLGQTAARNCYWVHFGLENSRGVDEFFAVPPNNILPVVRLLSQLIAAQQDGSQDLAGLETDWKAIAEACGIYFKDLLRLAERFYQADRNAALPGAALMGSRAGLAASKAVLGLNLLAGSVGVGGGIFLLPELPGFPSRDHEKRTLAEMDALLSRIKSERIKVLFVHGVDLLRDLPETYGAEQAFDQVERLISFSPLIDASSRKADYIFPDHTVLESWGFQKLSTGSDRPGLSAIQPVVKPRLNTFSTGNLLLQVMQGLGVELGFDREVDFIQQKIAPLISQGGVYTAHDQTEFWSRWLETGGWWKSERSLMPAVAIRPANRIQYTIEISPRQKETESGLQLVLNPLDDLKQVSEISHLEVGVHPRTAGEFGLRSGQKVRVSSSAASLIALVKANPRQSPGIVALPWQAGLNLVGRRQNVSGEPAWSDVLVRISPV
jgi:anaerobic selenocysteine-containing dehydrogenase